MENIKTVKKTEREKTSIIIMVTSFLKEIIKMDTEMEKEKNMNLMN